MPQPTNADVEGAANTYQMGEALYNLGRLYAELGQIDKSREAYGKILSENADTIYMDLVREKAGS